MGKWSILRDAYPALAHDEAVRAASAELATTESVASVTERINAARETLAELETQRKAAQFEQDACERALIMLMEDDGTEAIRIGGYLWSRTEEPHPVVVDRPALKAWADAHDPDSLSVAWQSLKATVKRALEDGTALPPGVDLFVKTAISRRKSS